MAKLLQFWIDRNKFTRAGFTWCLVLQLLRIILWYVVHNVGFPNMGTAAIVNDVYMGIVYLSIVALVIMVIGIIAEIYTLRMS